MAILGADRLVTSASVALEFDPYKSSSILETAAGYRVVLGIGGLLAKNNNCNRRIGLFLLPQELGSQL